MSWLFLYSSIMQKWQLTPDDPLALRLAADVRLGPTDYDNDVIWELDLASLTLATTCGGRGNLAIEINGRSPQLHQFTPNLLRASFQTASGNRAEAVWWAVDSHTVAVQISPANATAVSHHGTPADLAIIWQADQPNGRYVLSVHPNPETAKQLTTTALNRNWDTAFAQIATINATTPTITTGNPDWDASFAFAYKVALQSCVGPTAALPHPSFIFTRIPEQGHNHGWQWDGQVATEAYIAIPIITTAAPELAKGILQNYLAVQQEDGFIDWKPGLGGQRNGRLCIPLLAATAWHIYQQTEDIDLLRQIQPGLDQFLRVWYTPAHDRDQDGVPEWTDTIHSAFDDQPTFVPWQPWGQGANIQTTETPDLIAYLYREHTAMHQIATVLGQNPDPWHADRAAHLQAELASMWQRTTRTFHFRDRDSHTLPTHVVVLDVENEGGLTAVSLPVGAQLPQPNRALVRLHQRDNDPLPNLDITIDGINEEGWQDSESFSSEDVVWHGRIGTITGSIRWQFISRAHATGMARQIDHIHITTPNLGRQDQTQLLPLWAGMVNEAMRPHLIRTITDPMRYWRRYGIPNCAATDPAYAADNRDGSGGVWMMWNTMLGEGLIAAGHRAEAATLLRRLMDAIVHTLKTEKSFREAYNPDKLEGLGARDYLWGIAPVALFLQIVGIRIISAQKVVLSGYNPFPWPVTVTHHGVTVTRPPGQNAAPDVYFPANVHGTIAYE